MFISFVICTYNRASSLRETLESLFQQDFGDTGRYEVLVVNNNSTDETHEIVEKFAQKYPEVFRHVFEAKQGISAARNRALHSAIGDVIAFTDDDVDFDPNWASEIIRFAEQYKFDAAGGRIQPTFPKKIPKWLSDNLDLLSGPYVIHDYGEGIKGYDESMNPLVGANMIINKNSLQEIGGFNESLVIGEDTQCFLDMRQKGKKIYYCGKAKVFHKTDPGRMSLSYLGKWYERSGAYYVKSGQENTDSFKFIFGVPRYLFRQSFLCWLKAIPSYFFDRSAFVPIWIQISHIRGLKKAYRELKGH